MNLQQMKFKKALHKASLLLALLLFAPSVFAIFYNTGAFMHLSGEAPGSFSITGVTGSTDSSADAFLAPDTQPIINFGTSAGVTSYDILIRNNADTSTICSETGVASSPATVSSCTLTHGTTYKVKVTAVNAFGTTDASNQPYDFTVDTVVPTANSITGIDNNGTDTTNDAWLVGGNIATVNWNAFTNASSYDVTIRDSGGSTVVCATQNTTATSYTFTGCTLTNGTVYTASVVGKSALGGNSTAASNNNYSFTVDSTAPGTFSITGLTGGGDTTADASLNTSADPNVNWNSSSNATTYDVTIKDSTGTTTLCSVTGDSGTPATLTGCGLTDATSYKAYVTAKSTSGFMTQTASNEPFDFTVTIPIVDPNDFMITGATGGNDFDPDSWLGSGTEVTANWSASYGAEDYDVVIRNEADTADVCTSQNTSTNYYTFSGCTLTSGSRYRIKVTANASTSTDALNNGYLFEVIDAGLANFAILGVYGTNDIDKDHYLVGGDTTPIISFETISGATSYDVTIRNLADTADVCSTANTTSSGFTFTGCNLTKGTEYRLKVTAKNATTTLDAANTGFLFYVANDVLFCPTGSSTAKAITMYDSGGSGADYSKSESCTFNYDPTGSPSSINLDYYVFKSNDSGDEINIYDGTDATGSLLLSRAGSVSAPTDDNGYSGSLYFTWDSNNSPTLDGYHIGITTIYDPPSSFSIAGLTGGTDSTADNLLSNGTTPTVSWSASSGATSYQVTIQDISTGVDICPRVSTASTSYTFSSCSLTVGLEYSVRLYALNTHEISTAASNNNFHFKVGAAPGSFNITGITGGSDSTLDNALEDGVNATINWETSAEATSYDVTIYTSDGYTEFCSTVNVSAPTTSYSFSSCNLTSGDSYRVKVMAKNGFGNTVSTNNLIVAYAGSPWSAISTTNSPTATTFGSSAVWTGTEMIIWGGYSGSSINAGGKYNPATDTWVQTSTGTNVPAARYGHAAVWTGTEMIIWGGIPNSGNYYNTGAKYDPVGDSWTTTTTSGAASARQGFTYVWTGSEMIVWGGWNHNLGGLLNTGGRYNPSSDSWNATSTGANLPSAGPSGGEAEQGFWTGTEFIFRRTPSVHGRYNPTSDSWATMSSTNVPTTSSRYAWTGSKLFAWNVTDGIIMYDPASDSWEKIISPNGPTGIYANTAAYQAGSDVIVWSGSAEGGAKYSVDTNSWGEVTTSGAPAAEFPGVWTGTQLIIWENGAGGVYTDF